jgi:hypothetical protein
MLKLSMNQKIAFSLLMNGKGRISFGELASI